ncbi:Tim44-like domain-containing protein [Tardiphaga sp.]|jgi:predicted lipid-binding transport protein (Tim44 family)|uniref:Tim44-like domain-containing protein n=1 Tax=Tardiphaga sp. TaxID=1926292 RepID=UPI0037DA0898
MTFTFSMRGAIKTLAVVLSLAMPLTIAISAADARPGGKGGSMGSRGSKTFAPTPGTATAPNAAQPMNRTMQQPGAPGMAGPAAAGAAAKGGFFNRPGMGMLGGLAAGFLGAGLLGMLFGGGLLSGLGSFASIIGLLLQVALVVIVVRLAMKWWQRRNQGQTASAYAGPSGSQQQYNAPEANQAAQTNHAYGAQSQEAPLAQPRSALGGFGFGGSRQDERPVEIQPKDYEDFERILGEVQAAWSNEDTDALGKLATPEMTSYFAKDLAENKAANDINKVSDVKLLQGDLAEAWREGNDEYASVAMRFSLIDKTLERGTNRLVAGSETPTEATEVWTFIRTNGGNWEVSAIQQA